MGSLLFLFFFIVKRYGIVFVMSINFLNKINRQRDSNTFIVAVFVDVFDNKLYIICVNMTIIDWSKLARKGLKDLS